MNKIDIVKLKNDLVIKLIDHDLIDQEVFEDDNKLCIDAKNYHLEITINDKWIGYNFTLKENGKPIRWLGYSEDTDYDPIDATKLDYEFSLHIYDNLMHLIECIHKKKIYYSILKRKSYIAIATKDFGSYDVTEYVKIIFSTSTINNYVWNMNEVEYKMKLVSQ